MKPVTKKRLQTIFALLLAGGTAGFKGLACDCSPTATIVPRLPPDNPDGSPPPPFDPSFVSEEECEMLCGVGYATCDAITLDNGTPAVRCSDPYSCVGGRRPRGLIGAGARSMSRRGRFLAESAHLEAASVVAFDRLGAELRSLGAPRSLVRRALIASRQEERHARVMESLAARFGAKSAPVRVRRQGPRTKLAIALENAVEGCVNETFAALVASHQARFADDVAVKRAMARIAADETAHAALALDVDRWLHPSLTPRERARVARAKARAAETIVASWRSDPAIAKEMGLPSVPLGRALAKELWAAIMV